MFKLSPYQLTRLRRLLIITFLTFLTIHAAVVLLNSIIDAQWYWVHREMEKGLTNIVLGFAGLLIYGAYAFAVALTAVYIAFAVSYRFRALQHFGHILMPTIAGLSFVYGFLSLLAQISSGERPETALSNGLCILLLGSIFGGAMIAVTTLTTYLINDLWKPANE